MTPVFQRYLQISRRGLIEFGLTKQSELVVDKKLSDIEPRLFIEAWEGDDHRLLVSRGCSLRSSTGKYHDEFVIETGDGESFANRILTYVMYFHFTHRPVQPADCLEIGRMTENDPGYTHVYVSIPFYFPGSINEIRVDDSKFALNWLMPIYSEEALFIRQNGAEEFEKRLSNSGYGWFDKRKELTYLNEKLP